MKCGIFMIGKLIIPLIIIAVGIALAYLYQLFKNKSK